MVFERSEIAAAFIQLCSEGRVVYQECNANSANTPRTLAPDSKHITGCTGAGSRASIQEIKAPTSKKSSTKGMKSVGHREKQEDERRQEWIVHAELSLRLKIVRETKHTDANPDFVKSEVRV